MKSTETASKRLQTSGMRLTPQRLAIYEALTSSKQHPTAQEIYENLRPEYPSLSLATVYNTLELMVSLGMVNALGSAGDGAVHYDADLEPHVNLACISCHRVIDLPSEYVQSLNQEVSAGSGYQILGARVMYYGLCPECKQKNEQQGE
jgi:Fur family peroxide stress response transcriptional regulator